MSGSSFKKCHDHTGRKYRKCEPTCARSYSIQTCTSVCGLVAVTSTALAGLAKNVFQKLISKNEKLTGFSLQCLLDIQNTLEWFYVTNVLIANKPAKIFNLRRHISRLHRDISTENRENET